MSIDHLPTLYNNLYAVLTTCWHLWHTGVSEQVSEQYSIDTVRSLPAETQLATCNVSDLCCAHCSAFCRQKKHPRDAWRIALRAVCDYGNSVRPSFRHSWANQNGETEKLCFWKRLPCYYQINTAERRGCSCKSWLVECREVHTLTDTNNRADRWRVQTICTFVVCETSYASVCKMGTYSRMNKSSSIADLAAQSCTIEFSLSSAEYLY